MDDSFALNKFITQNKSSYAENYNQPTRMQCKLNRTSFIFNQKMNAILFK